jgi:hypothetical protein
VFEQGLFPFGWIITAKANTTATCPSSDSILGIMATENIGSLLLSAVTGNSKVVFRMTGGRFGIDSNSIKKKTLSWLLPFVMHLLSSIAVAGILIGDNRYATTFNMAELIVFFATRPRISWITSVCLQTQPTPMGPSYVASARSGTIAEAVSQALGLYIAGQLMTYLTQGGQASM